MVLSLALYLIGLAQWGRNLRENGATIQRRRLYGLAAAFLPVVFGLSSLIRFETRRTDAVAFTLGWSLVVGFLGYLTVVHCPKWLVGKYGQSEAERKMQEARQHMLRNLER
jgi:hypothetical protein